jgi:hypothetical protein
MAGGSGRELCSTVREIGVHPMLACSDADCWSDCAGREHFGVTEEVGSASTLNGLEVFDNSRRGVRQIQC